MSYSDANTRDKGGKAENAAAEYLTRDNYEILKRNFFFSRHGEIDIIAKDEETLVFVEVKSSGSNKYGSPLSWITKSKIRKLRRCAEGYLYVNKIKDVPCRFDVIVVDTKAGNEIQHLKNAF